MGIEEKYKYIIESLKLLATPYDKQKNLFPDFADIPDEVVSIFENAFLLLPELIEKEHFGFKTIGLILRTFNKMSWCLRNSDFDDFSSYEWNKVRELALKTLLEMNIQLESPNMDII